MGVFSEESCTKIVTVDNYTVENRFSSRDAAFNYLLNNIANISYKEAKVIDYNTGTVIVSMRSIK